MLKIIDFDTAQPDDEKPAEMMGSRMVTFTLLAAGDVPVTTVPITIFRKPDGTGEVRGHTVFPISRAVTITGNLTKNWNRRVRGSFNPPHVFYGPGKLTLTEITFDAAAMRELGF